MRYNHLPFGEPALPIGEGGFSITAGMVRITLALFGEWCAEAAGRMGMLVRPQTDTLHQQQMDNPLAKGLKMRYAIS